jgi:hypothetical protein
VAGQLKVITEEKSAGRSPFERIIRAVPHQLNKKEAIFVPAKANFFLISHFNGLFESTISQSGDVQKKPTHSGTRQHTLKQRANSCPVYGQSVARAPAAGRRAMNHADARLLHADPARDCAARRNLTLR